EFERFLFYRGVGNFKTPLKVAMNSAASVNLENSGKETLNDVFVLQVNGGHAEFVHLSSLKPGKNLDVALIPLSDPVALTSARLGDEIAKALTRQQLYPREAEAMVKTWKDSWFEEEGIRVLYLLPRKWTDEILPLNIKPQPRELVRVMVGRAEVISPDLEKRVA